MASSGFLSGCFARLRCRWRSSHRTSSRAFAKPKSLPRAEWPDRHRTYRRRRRARDVNVAALAAAFVALATLRHLLSLNATSMLRAVFVCGCLGIIAVFVSWSPAHRVPAIVLTLMPSRLVVINTMMLAAIVVGLAALLPRTRLGRFLVPALLIGCLLYRADIVLDRIGRERHAPALSDSRVDYCRFHGPHGPIPHFRCVVVPQ